jgi:hypothetical protein
MRGVNERKGGRGTGRVDCEQSWAGIISERVTEGDNFGLRPQRYGKALGFDKDNPERYEKKSVRLQQQRMESMFFVLKRQHVYCESGKSLRGRK